MEKKDTYVYFLRDPRDNSVRYIGITHKPKIRMNHHWSQRFYPSTNSCARLDKVRWLKDLDSIGLRPVMQLVLKNLSRSQAKRVEHYLVCKWNEHYPGTLLQGKTGLFDPMPELKKLWLKSHDKHKAAMVQFILDQTQKRVAS